MPAKEKKRSAIQMTLFQLADHPVVEKLRGLDLGKLPPEAALELLHQLQREASEHAN